MILAYKPEMKNDEQCTSALQTTILNETLVNRILKQMTGFRLLRTLSWKFNPSNVVILDVRLFRTWLSCHR